MQPVPVLFLLNPPGTSDEVPASLSGGGIIKRLPFNHEEAIEFISNIALKTKYDKVMDIIEEVIQMSGKKIPVDEKEKLLKSIRSRSVLKTLIT